MRGRIDRPGNIPETVVETATVAIARDAADYAIALRRPVHIVGAAGTGKSSALWHIAQSMGGYYCEISGPTKATKGLFELLLKTVGVWNGQKFISDLADAVYRAFEPVQRYSSAEGQWVMEPAFLAVDEVQTLEPTAFRELLRIQEKCEVGLIVAGNAERLAGKKQDAGTWDQIESRITMRRMLPGPSKKDCELIGSTFNVEGKEAYDALANFGMRTNLRDLTHLLEAAKRLSGGTTGIRKNHLEGALRTLNPKHDALRLLRPEAA